MKVRAFENLAQIRVLVGFWDGCVPAPFHESSETYMKALQRFKQLGLLQTGQRSEVPRDNTSLSVHGSEVLQQLLINAVVFRDLRDLAAFIDMMSFDDVPVETMNSIPHLIQSRVLYEKPGCGWLATPKGHEILAAMKRLEIEAPDGKNSLTRALESTFTPKRGLVLPTAPETVIAKPRTTEPVQPFQIWQKHAQALEGLLYRAHCEADEEIQVLARPTQKPFVEDENAVRLANAKLLETILYDLYCFNSEQGTTNEQDERLHRMGFTLFNNTAERLAKADEGVKQSQGIVARVMEMNSETTERFRGVAEQLKVERPVEILQDTLHEFDGYAVDLFKTDSGALGLTIERAPAHEDNPSIDIFVSKDLKVTGEGTDPHGLLGRLGRIIALVQRDEKYKEKPLLANIVKLALTAQDPATEARARVTEARRTAMANLMRNSVNAHYKDCPAESGGVCNCSWLVDGEVLRTWLDETTVFKQR